MSEGLARSAGSATSTPGVTQGNMVSTAVHLMEARRQGSGGQGKV